MSCLFVYVTFGTEENAQEIARDLVESGLVACANIFPPVQSFYKWEGEIAEEQEIVAIFKTRHDVFDRVCQRIETLHHYDVPCIVSLPVEKGCVEFLDWVGRQIK